MISDFFAGDESTGIKKVNGEFYKYLKFSQLDVTLQNSSVLLYEDLTNWKSNKMKLDLKVFMHMTGIGNPSILGFNAMTAKIKIPVLKINKT